MDRESSQESNSANWLIALLLSAMMIGSWHYFVERPKIEHNSVVAKEKNTKQEQAKAKSAASSAIKVTDRKTALVSGGRMHINSPTLQGSINLKGLRFDDITLKNYKETQSDNSENVALLSPTSTNQAYFLEFGWLGNANNGLQLPNQDTIWHTDNAELTPSQAVTLYWTNPQNIRFEVEITLDNNYMFDLKQRVINNSNKVLSYQNYGLINRIYEQNASSQAMNILHQGPIEVIDGNLEEFTYDNVKEKRRQTKQANKLSWLGITDKYWLTAIIPDSKQQYTSNFSYALKGGKDRYQADYISQKHVLAPGETESISQKMFLGAKKVDLLEDYASKYNIDLFDRAIDFGWLYMLTKPIFHALNFIYGYVGNFGLSIMIITIFIKLALFSLANHSYKSMKRMKKLQPKIEQLKDNYAEDKTKLNQEIMALYKREKVNPVTGCLPMIVQIPVFFAIYKVLYVTIEMRHSPFFGWIQDLSSPDPTTIFNLFGLLPFTPPSFLMIGAWPIIMALTMFLQQRMGPEPSDPIQGQMMKFMPLMFLFMFSGFPAGLLIYWSWNNMLSIAQQYFINRQNDDVKAKAK